MNTSLLLSSESFSENLLGLVLDSIPVLRLINNITTIKNTKSMKGVRKIAAKTWNVITMLYRFLTLPFT